LSYPELDALLENNKQKLAEEWTRASLEMGFLGSYEQLIQSTSLSLDCVIAYLRTNDITDWRTQVTASSNFAQKINLPVEKEMAYTDKAFELFTKLIEQEISGTKASERYQRRIQSLKALTHSIILAVRLRQNKE
jgi:hypothetical protein